MAVVATVLAVVAVAGVFAYDRHFATPAPARLALPAPTSSPGTSNAGSSTAALDGTWNVGRTSIVGYRVAVDAFGLSKTIVGRTNRVWGSVTVARGRVATGSFSVDMASFRGGKRERELIDAGHYRTATFVLTGPITLAGGSTDGAARHYTAMGELNLRGQTTPVTLVVSQERDGAIFYVLADTSIAFARWHVQLPFGVKSHGTIEVLLGLVRGPGNRGLAG